MTFTADSGLVKIWVRNVENGNYTREQVPALLNLKEEVYAVLDSKENAA